MLHPVLMFGGLEIVEVQTEVALLDWLYIENSPYNFEKIWIPT